MDNLSAMTILRERRRRKITQRQLADALGWTQNTLSDIELERVPVANSIVDVALNAMDEIDANRQPAKE